MSSSLFRSTRLVWSLALVGATAFGILGFLRPSSSQPWGDEGTYLAMTASLARDQDLLFQEADLEWSRSRQGNTTEALILQKSERGISYSKPVLYPILAAPFYALLGQSGLLVLNALVLSIALGLAWRSLRAAATRQQSGLLLVTFLCTGALLPYVGWKISEILQASLALGGLTLSLRGLRRLAPDRRDTPESHKFDSKALAFGSVLLGFLVSMRLTNVFIAVIPIVAALAYKKTRRTAICAAFILVGFFLSTGAGHLLTGVTNPYKATRASFNQVTGYPGGINSISAEARFETNRATSSLTLTPKSNMRTSAYSAFYFFLGRHTGVLWYFPASFVLALALFRRPDRVGLILFAGSGLLVLTYLFWLPDNYFGGSTFVGNRYYLVPYATLLLVPQAFPSRRSLLLVWLCAITVFASALFSIATTRDLENGSQSHTRAGIFRMLPFESTARRIDGQHDRRWLGDGIRSTDPFADVRPWGFVLDSSNPPAEILIAASADTAPIRFLVRTKAVDSTLRISDWLTSSTFHLHPDSGGDKSIVSFEPSRAWRRHPFGISGRRETTVQTISSLRFKLESSSSEPIQAWIQYLGDSERLETNDYSYEVLSFAIPTSVVAGSITKLPINVINRGDFTWTDSPVMPVKMGYKLRSEQLQSPLEGVPTKLFRTVRPGESLNSHVEVHWPEQPGTYQLTVDLVRENAFWFEERNGTPVARGWVKVDPGP